MISTSETISEPTEKDTIPYVRIHRSKSPRRDRRLHQKWMTVFKTVRLYSNVIKTPWFIHTIGEIQTKLQY